MPCGRNCPSSGSTFCYESCGDDELRYSDDKEKTMKEINKTIEFHREIVRAKIKRYEELSDWD